jgi:hypothetical protein
MKQKILQNSDFDKKRDLKPLPHGDIAAELCKNIG